MRLRSGIMYTLSEVSNEGHVYLEREKASELLDAEEDMVFITVDHMIRENELILMNSLLKAIPPTMRLIMVGDIDQLPSVGATNLILALREALNPPEQDIFMRGRGKVTMPKECLRRSGYAYRNDDKVMQIMMNRYVMLQRNLIYTGITRAKKALIIIGTKKALSYAIHNVTVTKRNTLLRERLM